MNELNTPSLSKITTICLIDDSDDEVFLANRMLKRENMDITLQPSSSQAEFFAYANSGPVFQPSQTLVVVDLYLGVEKGTDVIDVISERYPELIIGISTGAVDPDHQRRALDSGVHFYVGKPLDRDCLDAICAQVDGLSIVESDAGHSLIRHMEGRWKG